MRTSALSLPYQTQSLPAQANGHLATQCREAGVDQDRQLGAPSDADDVVMQGANRMLLKAARHLAAAGV
jgi:hypothetical protein